MNVLGLISQLIGIETLRLTITDYYLNYFRYIDLKKKIRVLSFFEIL